MKRNIALAVFTIFLACASHGASRELSSIADVRALTPEEAGQELPVEIKAQVARINNTHGGIFIVDQGKGIYLNTIDLPPALLAEISAGDILKISGHTNPGDFLPCIFASSLEVVDHRPLPEGRRIEPKEYMNPGLECELVRLSGRLVKIKSYVDASTTVITLKNGMTEMKVAIPIRPDTSERIQSLLFEWVECSAVAGTINNDIRQFVDRLFFIDSADQLKPVQRGEPQSTIETYPIHELLREGFNPEKVVRVFGEVTHYGYGELYLRGEKACLKATIASDKGFKAGQQVTLEGIVKAGALRPEFQPRSIEFGAWSSYPIPREVNLEEKLDSSLEFDLIKVRAVLVDMMAENTILHLPGLQLLCRSGDRMFIARYPQKINFELPLEIGSELELTGICHLEYHANPVWKLNVHGLWLQLRNQQDVKVIQPPPWWNTTRLVWAGSSVLVVALLILTWAILLRRTVEKQTRVIKDKADHEVVLHERQRIAREIHDGLQQGLAGIVYQLQSCQLLNRMNAKKLGESGETVDVRLAVNMFDESHQALQTAAKLTRYCSSDSRSAILELRGEVQDQPDLPSMIRFDLEPLQKESAAEVEIRVSGEERPLNRFTQRHVALIAKEAATNAIRHAQPTLLRIGISYTKNFLSVAVTDNGSGFDVDHSIRPGHFGIQGMQERANNIRAEFEIESTPSGGTTVTVKVPLHDEGTGS